LQAPQEKFPEAAIREAGYGVIWHEQKSWLSQSSRPKFDHKLRWLERLTKHAEELLATEVEFLGDFLDGGPGIGSLD
jgi:exonuclease III